MHDIPSGKMRDNGLPNVNSKYYYYFWMWPGNYVWLSSVWKCNFLSDHQVADKCLERKALQSDMKMSKTYHKRNQWNQEITCID